MVWIAALFEGLMAYWPEESKAIEYEVELYVSIYDKDYNGNMSAKEEFIFLKRDVVSRDSCMISYTGLAGETTTENINEDGKVVRRNRKSLIYKVVVKPISKDGKVIKTLVGYSLVERTLRVREQNYYR